jgi:O-antigen/teichoic acid export membrane protein
VLAVAFGIAAWVLGPTPGGYAAAAIAGLELAAWAFDRRAGLSKALLPTDAPYWIDRAVTVGAFTVGVVAAVVAIAGLFRSIRAPVQPDLVKFRRSLRRRNFMRSRGVRVRGAPAARSPR